MLGYTSARYLLFEGKRATVCVNAKDFKGLGMSKTLPHSDEKT